MVAENLVALLATKGGHGQIGVRHRAEEAEAIAGVSRMLVGIIAVLGALNTLPRGNPAESFAGIRVAPHDGTRSERVNFLLELELVPSPWTL